MNDQGISSLGVEEGIVAVGAYFGFVGLLLLIIEKKSSFVKFHALQSTLGWGLLLGFYLCVSHFKLSYLNWAPGVMCIAFTIFMMLKAYYGEEYRLPMIGKLAFHAVYDAGEDLLANDDD